MSDRLDEIEARHAAIVCDDRIGPKRRAQYRAIHEDIPWLIARGRADAAVVEAARREGAA